MPTPPSRPLKKTHNFFCSVIVGHIIANKYSPSPRVGTHFGFRVGFTKNEKFQAWISWKKQFIQARAPSKVVFLTGNQSASAPSKVVFLTRNYMILLLVFHSNKRTLIIVYLHLTSEPAHTNAPSTGWMPVITQLWMNLN
jgi:hypothetical protein